MFRSLIQFVKKIKVVRPQSRRVASGPATRSILWTAHGQCRVLEV